MSKKIHLTLKKSSVVASKNLHLLVQGKMVNIPSTIVVQIVIVGSLQNPWLLKKVRKQRKSHGGIRNHSFSA